MRSIAILAALARLAHADGAEKSPETAEWLSAGITTAGAVAATAGIFGVYETGHDCHGFVCGLSLSAVALGGTAFVFGPSAGHWYVDPDHGWTTGLKVRFPGMLAILPGVVGIAIECYGRDDPYRACRLPQDIPYSTAILVGAAGLIATGAVIDIATSGDHARRTLMIGPLRLHGGGGLSVGGTW